MKMTDHDLPGGYSRTDPNDSSVIVRRARKAHHCRGGHDGTQKTPCHSVIAAGVLYIEYTGESIPFMSGSRYHLDCAVQQGLLKRDPHTTNGARIELGTIVLNESKDESLASQINRQLEPIARQAWALHPNNPLNKAGAVN
jgi:hypothetical protein